MGWREMRRNEKGWEGSYNEKSSCLEVKLTVFPFFLYICTGGGVGLGLCK